MVKVVRQAYNKMEKPEEIEEIEEQCSQVLDQNQSKDTSQIQMLQDELKRAKLDVQAYTFKSK